MPLPAPAAERLWQDLAPVRARHPAARWSEPTKLHLTLVFLGQTDPSELSRLAGAVAAVGARWTRFEVATSGQAGGYIGRRGGVAWLAIGEGRRELSRLSRELDQAMQTGAFSRTAPRPHLTVARRVDERLLAELKAPESKLPGLRFVVDRLELLRSHTGPAGSRYESLAGVALS